MAYDDVGSEMTRIEDRQLMGLKSLSAKMVNRLRHWSIWSTHLLILSARPATLSSTIGGLLHRDEMWWQMMLRLLGMMLLLCIILDATPLITFTQRIWTIYTHSVKPDIYCFWSLFFTSWHFILLLCHHDNWQCQKTESANHQYTSWHIHTSTSIWCHSIISFQTALSFRLLLLL